MSCSLIRRRDDERGWPGWRWALAAGFWLLTALLLWALSQPEATKESGLLRTLHDLVYVSGGPAHVLTLGVFLGAITAAQWQTSLLPRWITWT